MALWRSLDASTATAALLRRGHSRGTIASLLTAGVVQVVRAPAATTR